MRCAAYILIYFFPFVTTGQAVPKHFPESTLNAAMGTGEAATATAAAAADDDDDDDDE